MNVQLSMGPDAFAPMLRKGGYGGSFQSFSLKLTHQVNLAGGTSTSVDFDITLTCGFFGEAKLFSPHRLFTQSAVKGKTVFYGAGDEDLLRLTLTNYSDTEAVFPRGSPVARLNIKLDRPRVRGFFLPFPSRGRLKLFLSFQGPFDARESGRRGATLSAAPPNRR